MRKHFGQRRVAGRASIRWRTARCSAASIPCRACRHAGFPAGAAFRRTVERSPDLGSAAAPRLPRVRRFSELSRGRGRRGSWPTRSRIREVPQTSLAAILIFDQASHPRVRPFPAQRCDRAQLRARDRALPLRILRRTPPARSEPKPRGSINSSFSRWWCRRRRWRSGHCRKDAGQAASGVNSGPGSPVATTRPLSLITGNRRSHPRPRLTSSGGVDGGHAIRARGLYRTSPARPLDPPGNDRSPASNSPSGDSASLTGDKPDEFPRPQRRSDC